MKTALTAVPLVADGDGCVPVATPPPVTPPPVTPPPVNPPVECITIPVVTVPVQCSCQCNLKPILKRLAKLEAQVKALQKKRP